MPEDPRIDIILERWEDLRQNGAEVSVEELCKEHPDLLDVVRKHVQALREMEWLDASGTDGGEKDNLEPVPQTLGRYRLDTLIGAGGYGQVWKGFDPELQRTVAIKIPRSGHLSSTKRTAQFLDEARKVAQLRPPGIVSVHDVGCDGDYCYIVSDFIDGGNLAELREKLSWEDAVRLVVKIADALQHAHAKGFIHRDIKLANILLDTNGSPYLTDFGIAVTEEELLESKTVTAGTLAFMSPEQIDGRPIDSRTDIYSLGVVLYELLVGRRPFVAAESVELRRAILSEEPAFPDSIKVPLRLKTICLKALAKDPRERYATATQFANELKALYEPRPKRRLLWSVISIVLLAMGGVIWFGLQQHQNQPLVESTHEENLHPSKAQEQLYLADLNPITRVVGGDPEDAMRRVTIGDRRPLHGLWAQPAGSDSHSLISYEIPKAYHHLSGKVGIASKLEGYSEIGGSRTQLTFRIEGDGKLLWKSHPTQQADDLEPFNIAIQGISTLNLYVDCPGNWGWAWAVWIDPLLTVSEPPKVEVPKVVDVLESPNTDVGPEGRYVDLLRRVDLTRDRVWGVWSKEGNAVMTTSGSILLPAILEGDYDLTVNFTRQKGENTIAVMLPIGQRRCVVVLSGWNGQASGIQSIDGEEAHSNPTAKHPSVLINGQRYTLVATVRRQSDHTASIEVLLDEAVIATWHGKESSLDLGGEWHLPQKRRFAFITNDPTTFHSAELRMVSGKISWVDGNP
jgi:serine/threonine protein kinase